MNDSAGGGDFAGANIEGGGMRVQFTVPGRPTRWERPGQGQLPDGTTFRYTNPAAREGKRAIAFEAKRAFGLRRPFTGPVIVRVIAIFGIPKSWPPRLRSAALEAKVMHDSDPDLDQLVKQVKDALVGIAYIDDNQVCGYPNSAKRYGHPERTEIIIEELPLPDGLMTPAQARREAAVAQLGWDAVLTPAPRRKVKRRAP